MNISVSPLVLSAPSAPEVDKYLTLDSDTSTLKMNHFSHHADGSAISSGDVTVFIQDVRAPINNEELSLPNINDSPSLKHSYFINTIRLPKFRSVPLARLPLSVENGRPGTRIIVKDVHNGMRRISHFLYDTDNRLRESSNSNYNLKGDLINNNNYYYSNNGVVLHNSTFEHYDQNGNKKNFVEIGYVDNKWDYREETTYDALGNRERGSFISTEYDFSLNVIGYYMKNYKYDEGTYITGYQATSDDANDVALESNYMQLADTIVNIINPDTSLLIPAIAEFQVKSVESVDASFYDQNKVSNVIVPVAH
ncbi:TPA: hypothetical protein PXO92_004013 [Yersinia enterocolitica]|nr:hypothetical protein [Yersinia enterocolitica]